MNFYEQDIPKSEKLIQKLQDNPDLRLKCYQLYLQNKIGLRKQQLEAWRQGRPFFDMDPHFPCFFRSMGFTPLDKGPASNPRDVVLVGGVPHDVYVEKAHALGLSTDCCCDMTYVFPSMIADGDMPLEPLVMSTNHQCTAFKGEKLLIAHKWLRDYYEIDVPFFESEAAMEYIVAQLRQFIEVAESKFPGLIKYDERSHIELLGKYSEVARLNLEIYELLKNVPSPIAGEDVNVPNSEWLSKDPNYLRARRDEIAERVANQVAAVPGEKLRVCWVGSKIRFMNPFKALANRGAAVVFWYSGNVSTGFTAPQPRPVYYGGRELTPLEQEAAHALSHTLGGTAAHYVDNLLRVCRDLKVDAIVHFQQLAASCVRGYKGLIEERAEKELGIPTLQLEGKRSDPNYIGEDVINAKLDDFVQMCLARKGVS